jgi:peptide/nickel transport system substrate-binding protein
MKKTYLCALAMSVLTFSLPAFSQAHQGGTLNMLVEPEPPTLLSVANSSGSTVKVTAKVVEGLLTYDNSLNPKPLLATSWSVSKDGKEYTFKLRKGVKWHDGKPFTSADVAFSILAVKKYNSRGASTFANVTDVKTPDAYTAVFVLSKPAPYLLAALSATEAPIIPKHLYEGTDIPTNPYNNAPVGTGPFKFKEWKRGSYIVYERNPDYWDKPKPYIDRLVVKIIPDAAARMIAFETGELDLAGETPVPLADLDRVKNNPKLGIETRGYSYGPTQTRIEFNLDNPYLKNLKVRQAIAHAINREVLKSTVWYGYAVDSPTPITPELAKYHDSTPSPYEFNPKKAEQLLDEAGFPRGANGVRFKLVHDAMPYGDGFKRVGEYIKSALGKVGIEVTLRTQDFPAYIKRVYTDRDFDFTNHSISNLSDPTVGVQRLYWSKSFKPGVAFGNGSHYSNPEVDKLLEQAAEEQDPAKRAELFKKFQRIVEIELPDVNLVQLRRLTIFNKRVHDHSIDAQGLNGSLADVYIE